MLYVSEILRTDPEKSTSGRRAHRRFWAIIWLLLIVGTTSLIYGIIKSDWHAPLIAFGFLLIYPAAHRLRKRFFPDRK